MEEHKFGFITDDAKSKLLQSDWSKWAAADDKNFDKKVVLQLQKHNQTCMTTESEATHFSIIYIRLSTSKLLFSKVARVHKLSICAT